MSVIGPTSASLQISGPLYSTEMYNLNLPVSRIHSNVYRRQETNPSSDTRRFYR